MTLLALLLSPFVFTEDAGSVRLADAGKPVFEYRCAMTRDPAAPAHYERCCYLHPIYAPDGTVLTADFPRDHYHHRGLSWMWPVVIVNGRQHDLWTLQGIRQRFVRWLARETHQERAVLRVENGWFTDDGRRVVREIVEIAARPGHRLELALSFEATEAPVVISGTPDLNKGYGGLGLRFARRTDTVLRTDTGVEPKDSDRIPHAWAELEGAFASGTRAGIRIDIDPATPGFPNGWCLRHYGYLGANFPGLERHTLEPGRPLLLRYQVRSFVTGPGQPKP